MPGERRIDAVVGVYAFLAALAVWALHPAGVAGLLIAPMLLCPGYAVVRAFGDPTDPLASVVLTVAVSLAVSALGGLALQALGVALTSRSWSALFGVVTLAGLLAAVARRSDTPSHSVRLSSAWNPSVVGIATLTGAVLVLAGVIAVRSENRLERARSTTQLAVTTSGQSTRVSVVNTTSASARYLLRVVSAAGEDSMSLRLAPGQRWMRSTARLKGPVSVRLFRGGSSTRPFRVVRLGRATDSVR